MRRFTHIVSYLPRGPGESGATGEARWLITGIALLHPLGAAVLALLAEQLSLAFERTQQLLQADMDLMLPA